MAKRTLGATPATTALRRAGIDYRLHVYPHHDQTTAYGTEAADALGVDPTTIFKTLIAEVSTTRGPELICAVVPVAGHLDLKALATSVGAKKATMADPEAAVRSTGYVLGGISPVGQRSRLRTVLDASADGRPTIMVSAGRRGQQVELAPADLITVTGAVVAPIGT
ncbi:MAG: Cys-tRNA(Pro) deacylase [Propionibacteriaceae bacterium]